jgi:WD40 repeat protein
MERTNSREVPGSFLHSSPPPKAILCVYAQEDAQFYRELQRYLYLWVRQQKITWLEISAGDERAKAMDSHLSQADLILLLLSADFLASDLAYQAMLTALAETAQRAVPVVPLLARVSAWKESECGQLSALPDTEQPIVNWLQRDEAYEHIRQRLLRWLPTLQAPAHPLPLTPIVSSRKLGFQVRELSGEYVVREETLAHIKQLLLDRSGGQTTAITTALRGAGGFGKTTLALAIAQDTQIQHAFPDGVWWIELGEHPEDPLSLFNRLLPALGETGTETLKLEEAKKRWQKVLTNKTCLLVIDDVWQTTDLQPLLEGGPRCRRLVTTRNDWVLPQSAQRVVVDAMSRREAIAMLTQGLPIDSRDPSTQIALEKLVGHLGCWPLLLSVARGLLATQLRYGQRLPQALAAVMQIYQGQRGVSVQAMAATGFRETMDASLQASFRQVQEMVAAHYQPVERYQELAVFPEDTDIPLAAVRLFWQGLGGLEPWETDDLCMQLAGLSLLLNCDLEAGTIRLHDVTRSYLIERMGPRLPALHAQFLDAMRQGLGVQRWAEITPANTYLWHSLIWHLCQAGRWEDLQTTLMDLGYLIHKVSYQGVYSLVKDLSTFRAPPFQVPQGVFERYEYLLYLIRPLDHLLQQARTPAEIGSVLLSHLVWHEPFRSQRHLIERELARPFLTPWLRPLPRGASSAILNAFYGHSKAVRGCAVIMDGREIVSASADHTLKVWDGRTGTERLSLRGHSAPVYGCAVSGVERLIVSASADHTLKVWDTSTGTERLSLRGHSAPVYGCAVNEWRREIVSASADHTLKVWDASTGAKRRTLRGHSAPVYGCAVSGDGDRIVSASADHTLKVWDGRTGAKRLSLCGHSAPVYGCAVSARGDRIVSASADHTLKVWDGRTGAELLSLGGHSAPVYGCAVSARGDRIVSASADRTLKVWDGHTGAELLSLGGHSAPVYGCAVSVDGYFIVSASEDKILRAWHTDEASAYFLLRPSDSVYGCAVSSDGHLIVSSSHDGMLKVWDGRTGAERLSLRGHSDMIFDCAGSMNGRFIVSASADHTLKVWDASTGAERLSLRGHFGSVQGCAVSTDGRFIVSASADHTLKVWDASTGAERLSLRGHSDWVQGCAVSADGRFIVSASDDHTLKVWETSTGAERLSLRGHSAPVRACAMSADGRFIVSASSDHTLKVWDTSTGAERLSLRGHSAPVHDCAVGGDGRFIVSVSADHTLKVWEAQSGRCLLTFPVDGPLFGCAIHPDGEHLVACGSEGMYFLRLVM